MPIFTSANAAPLYVAHTPAATSAALIHRNADFIPLLYAPMFEWIRMFPKADPMVGEWRV
jgi:hypothetical protein